MKKLLLLAALVALPLLTGCATRGFPAQHGIVNFDQVDYTRLYRGGQPPQYSIAWLKDVGVKSVVNLRMPDDSMPWEDVACKENGIVYTNLPLNGIHAPTAAQMKVIVSTLGNLPGPIFVHCQHGCDRTGTVVACYRMYYDSLSSNEAYREAVIYGISPLEIGMRRFIKAYNRKR